MGEGLDILSQAFGWSYFACWGFFVWPQLFQNWRTKSVKGLSLDSVLIDQSIGTIPYAIFCLSLYFNPTIKELYQRAHGADSPAPVKLNDVVLLVQALFLLVLLIGQCLIYEKAAKQTLSRVTAVGCAAIWVSIGVMLALCTLVVCAFIATFCLS